MMFSLTFTMHFCVYPSQCFSHSASPSTFSVYWSCSFFLIQHWVPSLQHPVRFPTVDFQNYFETAFEAIPHLATLPSQRYSKMKQIPSDFTPTAWRLSTTNREGFHPTLQFRSSPLLPFVFPVDFPHRGDGGGCTSWLTWNYQGSPGPCWMCSQPARARTRPYLEGGCKSWLA